MDSDAWKAVRFCGCIATGMLVILLARKRCCHLVIRKSTSSAREAGATAEEADHTLANGCTTQLEVVPDPPEPRFPTTKRKNKCKAISSSIACKTQPPCMKLDYLDRFLRWECGLVLQDMCLFPNAKEITESMACLQAVEKHLDIRFNSSAVICVVIGDGSTPRTAALLAMRTKWRRVLSIDPALEGLPLSGCTITAAGSPKNDNTNALPENKGISKRRLNKAEQQAHQASQVAPRRERIKDRLARIGTLDRLELVPCAVESCFVDVDVGQDRQILVILPHAHVVPEVSLRSLRLDKVDGILPSVSIIQLPCCQYKLHNTILGKPPDVEYTDSCICGPAQQVRVWQDVSGVWWRESSLDVHADITRNGSKHGRRSKKQKSSDLALVNFKAASQPQYHRRQESSRKPAC